jgi:hypothetical protein
VPCNPSGRIAVTVTERPVAEIFDRGQPGRNPMLTLLAPDIVEAVMDGRQPAEVGVHVLRQGFPVEWGEQREGLNWTERRKNE